MLCMAVGLLCCVSGLCCGLYSWPVGWKLCPCSVPVLVEAVSLRPVGGLWGRIYQAPGRLYRARKTPRRGDPASLGRRPASGPAPGGRLPPLPAPPVLEEAARRPRRGSSAGPALEAVPVVALSALVGGASAGAGGGCPPPRTAPRKTPEKTRRIFPACLPDLSRRRSRSRTRPGSTSPAGPLQAGRRTGKNPVGKFRRGILRARSKSCFLVY